MSDQTAAQQIWRKIFVALSIASLLILPLLSIPHGQSGDEWIQTLYGTDVYNYFFYGDPISLDYNLVKTSRAQMEGLHYYGALYDFAVVFLHKTFFPFTDELLFHHMVNAVFGALLFIYTGLLGRHFGGWRCGVLAFLLIALSPRILGESMNNPKDIPFAFANVFFLYYLVRYLAVSGQTGQWKYVLLMGLGLGLAMGFRIGGIVLIPYTLLFTCIYFLWDTAFREKLRNGYPKALLQMGLHFGLMILLGYIICILFWPWALQEPFTRPFKALEAMTRRRTTIWILFEGAFIMNKDVPWYYTIKWIAISSPAWVLCSFLLGIAMLRPLARRYGKPVLFLLFFSFFFPILYTIYRDSVLYDTWRHFFFIYPAMVLLSALTCNYLLEYYAARAAYRYTISGVIGLGLALPLLWIARSFPNEYIYFNELSGGIKGAVGIYDLDYYQNSGKQAADWIKEHIPRRPGGILVASNMSAYEKYFTADTPYIQGNYCKYKERDTKDWDYYVTYSRYVPLPQLENNAWPPANAVHVIRVAGVPISAVLERRTKKDMAAYAAVKKQQFDTALILYQQSAQEDPSNEIMLVRYAATLAQKRMLRESLTVLDQAEKMDNSNKAVYKLRTTIYSMLGDNARSQEAANRLKELTH